MFRVIIRYKDSDSEMERVHLTTEEAARRLVDKVSSEFVDMYAEVGICDDKDSPTKTIVYSTKAVEVK